MRPAGPHGNQAIVGHERGTENVVLVIPVSEPRAEEQIKHAPDVAIYELGRAAVVVEAGVAQAADRGVAAGTAAVGEEIIAVRCLPNPDAFLVVELCIQIADVARADEWGEAAEARRRKSFAAANAEVIAENRASRSGGEAVTKV